MASHSDSSLSPSTPNSGSSRPRACLNRSAQRLVLVTSVSPDSGALPIVKTPAAASSKPSMNITPLAELLSSGAYSDFTITCKGRKFKVHKAVIGIQSSVFAAALNGNFQEAQGEMKLEDHDPAIVAAMIKFLYTQDYDETFLVQKDWRQSPKHINEEQKNGSKLRHFRWRNGRFLINNVELYIIADKYDISPLKTLAAQKYAELVPKLYCNPHFAHSLKLMYEETPTSDTVLKRIALNDSEHIKQLMQEDVFVELLKSNHDLCLETLNTLVPRNCMGFPKV